jgi:hypothetical protein
MLMRVGHGRLVTNCNSDETVSDSVTQARPGHQCVLEFG